MTIVNMDCNRERGVSLLHLLFMSLTTKQLKLTDKKTKPARDSVELDSMQTKNKLTYMHTRTHARKQAHTTHYFQRNPKPPHSSSSNNFASGLSLLQKRHTRTQKRQSGNKKGQQENSIQTLSKNFAFHFT